MEIEKRIRPDLWKAIQAHYERNDYTESVRDAVYHVSEVLREKSGLVDKDGSKLVEAALMGSNPAIVIGKNETTTEKDFQQGIAFSFKGIMLAIRNPLSLEKTEHSREDAEAIIFYINYLLNQVDHSGGHTKIESITSLLYDEDMPSSEEYADLLLKEVPIKKRYDLLVELFNNRENLRQEGLHNFIDRLYDSLSKASKADFTRLLNTAMLRCKDDTALRMYINYFMKKTYSELDRLVQIRVEDFIFKAIKKGKMVTVVNPKTKEPERECVAEASLATWLDKPELVSLLGNAEEIFGALLTKILYGTESEEEFVFEHFDRFLDDRIENIEDYQNKVIIRRLSEGDEHLYNYFNEVFSLGETGKLFETFGEAFHKCEEVIKKKKQEEELLPF